MRMVDIIHPVVLFEGREAVATVRRSVPGDEAMLAVRVGRRGQVTIPSSIRRLYGLEVGDTLVLDESSPDGLVLRPVRKTVLDLRGSVRVTGPQDFQAVRATAREARGEERVR